MTDINYIERPYVIKHLKNVTNCNNDIYVNSISGYFIAFPQKKINPASGVYLNLNVIFANA